MRGQGNIITKGNILSQNSNIYIGKVQRLISNNESVKSYFYNQLKRHFLMKPWLNFLF